MRNEDYPQFLHVPGSRLKFPWWPGSMGVLLPKVKSAEPVEQSFYVE
jgi:hypothetical protein